MYTHIIGLLIIIAGLFLIYKFYNKINDFIIKNILPSQHVKQIKHLMKDLDEKGEKSKNHKILETLDEIIQIPIIFLYKLMVTYVTPIFYNISQQKN